MGISQLITGICMVVIGLVLVGLSFFSMFVTLIYGIPILVIGIVILLNDKEDYIEPIKSKGGNK